MELSRDDQDQPLLTLRVPVRLLGAKTDQPEKTARKRHAGTDDHLRRDRQRSGKKEETKGGSRVSEELEPMLHYGDRARWMRVGRVEQTVPGAK